MKVPKLNRFGIALGAGILFVVLVVGGVAWAFLQQVTLAQQFRGQTRRLEQTVATQRAEQAYLTATLTYVHTDAYVEQWAREEAKMAKPGEVVVIPVGEGEEPPPPTPEAEPVGTAPPSESRPFWEVWWEVLTGGEW